MAPSPQAAMWKEVTGRVRAEGQGLIGLSPDGKQLAEAQTKDGFLPFLVIAEMRRQGRNLPQMEEGPEEFGMRPRGPAMRQRG